MKCEECGNTIDASLPGYGHRGPPKMCGHYTFTVNPEVIAFLNEQPKDATPEELTTAWLRKCGILK